jgi:hypothetical protein
MISGRVCRLATERLCGFEGGESMEITLVSAEKLVLREIVEKAINVILMEIAHTDNRKMREGLKEREEILMRILEKLPAEVSVAA